MITLSIIQIKIIIICVELIKWTAQFWAIFRMGNIFPFFAPYLDQYLCHKFPHLWHGQNMGKICTMICPKYGAKFTQHDYLLHTLAFLILRICIFFYTSLVHKWHELVNIILLTTFCISCMHSLFNFYCIIIWTSFITSTYVYQ